MKKFIYLFILIFLVFGCSSSVNNGELDQLQKQFDTFANKYYSDLNKFGWKKALSNAVGDYAVFKNSFKQYVFN